MTDKIYYTNEQLAADLHEINRQMLLDNYRPDVIVGIARGGLVPATMLSHYHNKPLMIVNTSLRDNMVSHEGDIQTIIAELKNGKHVLLVDDICDSGITLRKVVDEITPCMDSPVLGEFGEWTSRLRTAVLWNNMAQDVFEPEYVGREINRLEDDRWLVFPYEEWWKV